MRWTRSTGGPRSTSRVRDVRRTGLPAPADGGKRRPNPQLDGPFCQNSGRLFGVGFIRLYQLTLSGFIGNSCRHIPTCSEYGYEAIARHGLWAGGWMTLFRVARCGPAAQAVSTRCRKRSMTAGGGGCRGVTGA